MFSNLLRFIFDPKSVGYNPIYCSTAFLSPLYQSLLSETEKKIAKKCLKEEVQKYEEAAQEANSGEIPEVPNTQEEEEGDDFIGAGLFSNLKPREVQKMKKESTSDKKLATDFERLEKDAKDLFCKTAEAIAAKKPRPPPEDPLDYWIRMLYLGNSKLASVACDLLVIPATSCPSERFFSLSGFLSAGVVLIDVSGLDCILSISGRRHRISNENLERRCLLKANNFDT